jgi:predicted metal-binding membrane protein
MNQAADVTVLERLLRRDRSMALLALIAAVLLAWTYLLAGIGMEGHSMSMPDMAMPGAPDWTASRFALMFAMWGIMMVATMLPGAAPMILLFATIERRRRDHSPLPATLRFAGAYVAVWLGFSLVATLLQWQLDRLTLLSSAMATTSALLSAVILIAAGIYQFTPWKQACLRNCRTPLEFISAHWSRGAFGIGLRHGLYCLGCCWMIMLLLFVGGVMNLVWVALIATYILAEKALPRAIGVSYGMGAVLIGWGAWTLYAMTMA